ncbi:MAG: hypothetical protein JW900_14150 [Anaerolineae bacterium]|nr:hypothetical protein [Anaerolineae bacterium]
MSEEMYEAPPKAPEPEPTASTTFADPGITDDDKLWAALSWPIWPLAIILLLIDKKDRPFIKYNAVQALVLGAVAYASTFIAVGVCLAPLAFIYAIVLAFKVYKGEWVEVPVITNFCEGQGWISRTV